MPAIELKAMLPERAGKSVKGSTSIPVMKMMSGAAILL